MSVIRKQIGQRIKGALGEKEDWFHLCYDTETKAFHVEHSWSHTNAYNIAEKSNEGEKAIALEGYEGIGAENIAQAKAALLAEAGHA